MSLMRRHQAEVYHQATLKAVVAANRSHQVDEYRLMLNRMHQDQQQLKQLPDHLERNRKAVEEFLPNYLGYLRAWLAAGQTHQNDVLTQCVVWVVDGGRWDLLQELAGAALRLSLPLHWMKRSLAEFVADGVFRAAEAVHKTRLKTPEAALSPSEQAIFSAFWWVQQSLSQAEHGWAQANQVIRARFHKLAGVLSLQKGNLPAAYEHFSEADRLYPNIAVKGKLKEVEAALANDSSVAQQPQPVSTAPALSSGG